jgi:hypothetical protein
MDTLNRYAAISPEEEDRRPKKTTPLLVLKPAGFKDSKTVDGRNPRPPGKTPIVTINMRLPQDIGSIALWKRITGVPSPPHIPRDFHIFSQGYGCASRLK